MEGLFPRTDRSLTRAAARKPFPQSSNDPEMDWIAQDTHESVPRMEGSSPLTNKSEGSIWLADTDDEVLNQLLISTEGTNLCLHDPWTRSTRRVRRDIKSEIEHDYEYFCILEVSSFLLFPFSLLSFLFDCLVLITARSVHVNALHRLPDSNRLAPQTNLLSRHKNL